MLGNIFGKFKSLSSLPGDDRAAFVAKLQQSTQEHVFYVIKYGAAIYTLFFIYDIIVLPNFWKHFLVVRLSLVIPTIAYVTAIERGILRFGVETKIILFAPVTWATCYGAVTVPRNFFIIESSLNILLVFGTATFFCWFISEYILYAFAVMLGSTLFWHLWTDLSVNELTLGYFMNLTALITGFLFVQLRVTHDINDFLNKKQLLQHERLKNEAKISAIEWRLVDADRNAYLAKHLGLFLQEIRNTLLSIDVAATSGSTNPHELSQQLEIIKKSGDLTRNLIEAFLGRIKAREASNEVLEINSELHAVLPLIRYHTEKNGMNFEEFVETDISVLQVHIKPGAISLILFNITRSAISSLNNARFKFPGQTFAGRIALTITKINGYVMFVVEDNGIGLSGDDTGGFSSQKLNGLDSDLHPGQGFMGLRPEADENDFEVKLEPRLGGGTVATVIVPIYSPLSEFIPPGNRGSAA